MGVRVARGVASSNSSFLSATKTSQVLHISMNAQLTHEPIVLYEHFFPKGFVWWRHERAQYEYEARLRNWIWLDKFTHYVMMKGSNYDNFV